MDLEPCLTGLLQIIQSPRKSLTLKNASCKPYSRIFHTRSPGSILTSGLPNLERNGSNRFGVSFRCFMVQ